MHPNRATLIALGDGEARGGRVSSHLSRCAGCRDELRRIRSEKDEFSARAAADAGTPSFDIGRGLAEVQSAIDAWRGRTSAAAPELASRVRAQIEIYLGTAAVSAIDRPGAPTEQLLANASAILEVLLGRSAAEAIENDVFHGLDWTARDWIRRDWNARDWNRQDSTTQDGTTQVGTAQAAEHGL